MPKTYKGTVVEYEYQPYFNLGRFTKVTIRAIVIPEAGLRIVMLEDGRIEVGDNPDLKDQDVIAKVRVPESIVKAAKDMLAAKSGIQKVESDIKKLIGK